MRGTKKTGIGGCEGRERGYGRCKIIAYSLNIIAWRSALSYSGWIVDVEESQKGGEESKEHSEKTEERGQVTPPRVVATGEITVSSLLAREI